MFWADQFQDERICLLTLEGRLSGIDLMRLSERLRGLAARGVSRVVVDLREVGHWDFRGLTDLVEAVRLRSRHGGTTAFVTPSPYLRDIAAAAGILEELDLYDELRNDEAPKLTLIETPIEEEPEDLREATGR